ncbi:LysR family transcriptional regulator, partial [Phytoactinopolyspora endophytica]|uniref:LysR family transcriptional regulator n=1 Tax=Phytoactinopolyspora endophytica TaxID=1642495 RepID=UPI0013EC483E
MQPHQLQYFVAVAETGSFTAGAQRARVVQSAVSVAVRQLEHELQTSLFVRGRRIRLTQEGEALLPRARDVLAAMEAATAAVAATREMVTGTVNLGMLFRFATFDMASSLASFQRKYPAVVVRGQSSGEGSRGHREALRRGDLDLALLSTAPGVTSMPGMYLERLGSEPIRFVCATSHPLADSEFVRLEQLTDEIFIDLPAGWGNRSLIDSAFASAGLLRAVRTETIDFAMSQALAAEEL